MGSIGILPRLTLIGGWNYANVWTMMGGRCRVIAFVGLQLKVIEYGLCVYFGATEGWRRCDC